MWKGVIVMVGFPLQERGEDASPTHFLPLFALGPGPGSPPGAGDLSPADVVA